MRAHASSVARRPSAPQLALALAAPLPATATHRAERLLIALGLDVRPLRLAPLRWTLTLLSHTSPLAEGRTRDECLHAALGPLVALAREAHRALVASGSPDRGRLVALAQVIDAEGTP